MIALALGIIAALFILRFIAFEMERSEHKEVRQPDLSRKPKKG